MCSRNKRSKVRVRNEAEILMYSTQQTLEEHGDTISKEDKEQIEMALKDLKKLMKKKEEDIDEIKKATETLSTAVYKIAELMYNTTAKQEFVGSED